MPFSRRLRCWGTIRPGAWIGNRWIYEPSTWEFMGSPWGSLTTNSIGAQLAWEFAFRCIWQHHVRSWNLLPPELSRSIRCTFRFQAPEETVLSDNKSTRHHSLLDNLERGLLLGQTTGKDQDWVIIPTSMNYPVARFKVCCNASKLSIFQIFELP